MRPTEDEIRDIQERITQEYAFRDELLDILDVNDLNDAKKLISEKLKRDKEFSVRYEKWIELTGYKSWIEFYEEETANYDYISKEMLDYSDEGD